MSFFSADKSGTDLFTTLSTANTPNNLMSPTNCFVYDSAINAWTAQTTCPNAKGICKSKLGIKPSFA
jgi:hypothetical protein